MEPTYNNNQIVILNKISRDYIVGDVVAFQCSSLSSVLVKRIVACPGDSIVIKHGKLYINDKLSSVIDEDKCFTYAGLLDSPLILEEGQYCVIGDNIEKSKDSRYEEVGPVNIDCILGRVV